MSPSECVGHAKGTRQELVKGRKVTELTELRSPGDILIMAIIAIARAVDIRTYVAVVEAESGDPGYTQ